MGMESELGPIDPSINNIPVDFILNAPPGSFNALDMQVAQTARNQTRKLATDLLSTGMMQGQSNANIELVIDKLATRDHYHSHGSVIDAREAKSLHLNVTAYSPSDPLWQKLWLLRTMYQYDSGQNGYAKLFESNKVSTAVTVPKQP
jgi:hypothetical protein